MKNEENNSQDDPYFVFAISQLFLCLFNYLIKTLRRKRIE